MDEQEKRTLSSSSTHLTPAEAGRLLGKSPVRVREMIRFGELTQEQVDGRWLIPLRDVEEILHPSPEPRDDNERAAPNYQRPKHNQKLDQGKVPESTYPSLRSISKAPAKKTRDDLWVEIESLHTRMNQIDGELRVLRSGLMNDEKRERLEKLNTEKRKHGENLQKLQRELSRRENQPTQRF